MSEAGQGCGPVRPRPDGALWTAFWQEGVAERPLRRVGAIVAHPEVDPPGPVRPYRQTALCGLGVCGHRVTTPQGREAHMAAVDATNDWLWLLGAFFRLYQHEPVKGGLDIRRMKQWRDERLDRDVVRFAVENDWPCLVLAHVLYVGLTVEQVAVLTPEGLREVYFLAALMPEPHEMVCARPHEMAV